MMQLIEQLLYLPVFVGALLMMVITTLAGLVVYVLTYRLLAQSPQKETRRAANYLFRGMGILVSLFLSLTFADVMLELNQIEASIEREAIMIEDIHRDLARYDSDRARRAQVLLEDYLEAVIHKDWPALANDKLSEEARILFSRLEYEVLHLEDDTELQGILRSRIIADVDLVSDLRLSRLEQALAKPPLFLVVVIFGFLATMVCFGPHQPNKLTVTLVSLYTLLIGLVIYLILAYSDPFQGATGIDPTSLQYVLDQIRR
jgi:hypothetical protein